jgi:hypothetical protein
MKYFHKEEIAKGKKLILAIIFFILVFEIAQVF